MSAIVTAGFGSSGSIALIVTMGFNIGAVVLDVITPLPSAPSAAIALSSASSGATITNLPAPPTALIT